MNSAFLVREWCLAPSSDPNNALTDTHGYRVAGLWGLMPGVGRASASQRRLALVLDHGLRGLGRLRHVDRGGQQFVAVSQCAHAASLLVSGQCIVVEHGYGFS